MPMSCRGVKRPDKEIRREDPDEGTVDFKIELRNNEKASRIRYICFCRKFFTIC